MIAHEDQRERGRGANPIPTRVVRQSSGWRLSALSFVLASVSLALVGWVAYHRLLGLQDATRWVEHTLVVRNELETTLSLLKDAETGQRGFLVTGATSYLEPYNRAVASLGQRLERLRQLTADNPTQQASLAALDGLIGEKLHELRTTISARENNGLDAASRIVLTDDGKHVMDRIRVVIGTMRAEEDQLLAERRVRETRDARAAIATTVGGLVFALALTVMATVLLTRAARADATRIEAQAQAAALALSEGLLRVTLASIGDAVIATDPQGHVTFLNAIGESLTGWTETEALGRPLEEVFVIVNEQSRQPAEQPIHRALRLGETTGLANHTVLVTKDGREVPIDDSAAPIKAADGLLLGAIMVFRDITERKKTDERFRLAIEAAPTAMVMVDQQGTILLVNALTEELFGYARHELLGQPIEHLLPHRFRGRHPKDRAHFFLDPRRRVMGAGRDLYGLCKDGTEVPVEIGLSPLKSRDGLYILAAIADITQRKRAEQRQATLLAVTRALAESPTLKDVAAPILEAVCSNLDWDVGAFWTVDREAGVLRCVDVWHRPSVTVAEFEGVTRESTFARGVGLIGRVWESGEPAWIADVVAVDNCPRAPVAAREGLHGAFAVPIRFGDEVHGVIEFYCRATRQPDPDLLTVKSNLGSQIGQFIARRRAEDERAQFLTREQAARREAETANRSKDEFLAMLSHELRTPLSAILGWTQILRSGSIPEGGIARALEVIERNAKVQTDLIEDLLDVSRIESGKLTLEIRPVDPVPVVEAALDAVRSAAGAKQIHLEIALEASGAQIAGDPGRLQQVVWNLLSNAIKFTPQGGRVTIRLERIDSRIQITVHDEGIGIRPDFLPHVFERFQQAAGGRRSGGLGLGLTIVRHIVELHGGTVEAASPGEGRGATFTVMLPVMAVRMATRLAEAPLAAARDVLGHRGALSGVRVLVVDDDSDTGELLALVLTPHGADVRSSASVSEALEIFRSWHPDVLVSDIGMPEEDGFALIRQVRAFSREEGGQIPAIALTGFAKVADRSRALLHGFQLHVTKPVEPAELVAAVANLAGRTGSG